MTGGSFLSRLPTHRRTLKNGLVAVVREDHSAPVVAIVTHVRAGYFDEPDEIVGISHVLEHMYFKGTERRGVGEIAQATKAAGGYLNASTSYDYTSYYTVLPASSLPMGLDIQADALRHSQLDAEELQRELLVIIQEARRKLDNPSAVATETLYEEMFDVHRMRRRRIGTEEALSRLTRADVWNYYRALYHPSNLVLVVAGDVDPDAALALIERHYGDMPAGVPARAPAPEEPQRRGFRFREISGDIVDDYAEWGWRSPGTLDPDTPALDLLAVVLGQGRASRLYRGVREAGLVTAVGAQNFTPTEIGVFGVGAELPHARVTEALEAIAGEVAAVREGVPEAELERARNVLEARMLRRTETVEGQASLIAHWQALGEWRLADSYLERVMATTEDDLRRVAARHLRLDDATVLVYRPNDAEPLGWTGDALHALLAKAAARPAASVAAPAPPAPAVAPAAAQASTARAGRLADGVHFYELEGGTPLVVRPRRSAALVSMSITLRGGSLAETPDDTGLTALLARVSLKGTETRSGAELAAATESLGGSISAAVGADLTSWGLSVPARHFERALPLLADPVLHPTFPAAEVDRERGVMASELERSRDDMFQYPARLFLEAAFGPHPYGASLEAAEAALARFTTEDLVRWHEAEVLGGHPMVLVVGDVEPERAAAVVGAVLGGIRGGADRPAPPRASWPAAPVERAAGREKAQTALMMGFPGPARNDPELPAMRVLSNVVSGLGGRFFEELRGRRSLAYTVTAYPIARWLAGAFVGYIATSPEREAEAREGLLAGVRELREELVTEAELERARRYTIGAWQIRAQTNGAQLRDLAGALLLGRGLEDLRVYEAEIRAVDAEAVRSAARRFLDPDRLVEGAVRGRGGGR